MSRYCFILGVVLYCSISLAYAEDQEAVVDPGSLQQQIYDLQKRVTKLENRKEETNKTVNIISHNKEEEGSVWQQLKIGMSYKEVTQLLGKPAHKTRGSIEVWYYSADKSDGPFAKFIFNRLNNWRAP
ncbi:MAG: outer membrane protein assembly factor BamE [Gammaproteobacteria bacterium]|nr:outer membrane protein assembly factor BamE [Gammaproteobacteria bacterium]